MKTITTISELKKIIKEKKAGGIKNIGLVPTMGALHKGHLSLIERSVKENDITIVSVFVNPVQFGPNEDYDKYPRTLENDIKLCAEAGVDIVFAPSPKEMYCENYFINKETTLICPPYSDVDKLCGKSRPGHFDGVCTVVAKLFNLTKCTRAYFGKKDYQQLFIIKKMVADLNFDVDIIPCPIIREDDGLALSSRNTYLDENARKSALMISKALFKAKELYENGVKESEILIDSILAILKDLDVEYAEVVCIDSFEKIDIIEQKGLILIAAKVCGKNTVRLIDNIEL